MTLLVKTVLVPPLTNVHHAMKPDNYFLKMVLVLKNAQILSTLIKINLFVTLVIALAKLVLDHHPYNA